MNQNYEIKWLIAQIKPNSYDLAVRNLERQGFETFSPKMKATIKKENKFFNKDSLVFPGYIFVGVDLQNSYWTKINSTYGVSKLLVFNYKPSTIPNDMILELKIRYEENINLTTEEKLKKGDTIKFHSGPFVDLIARIETLDGENRIWALLETIGKYKQVKIKLKTQQAGKVNFTKF